MVAIMPSFIQDTYIMATQKTVAATGTTAERKKADAWINFNLPVKSKTTGQVKMKSLGGIPLDFANPLHNKLVEAVKSLDQNDLHQVVSEFISQGQINLVIVSDDNDDFELGA